MLRAEKIIDEQIWSPEDEAGEDSGPAEVRKLAQSLSRKIVRKPALSLATGANTLPSLVRHLLNGLESSARIIAKNEIN